MTTATTHSPRYLRGDYKLRYSHVGYGTLYNPWPFNSGNPSLDEAPVVTVTIGEEVGRLQVTFSDEVLRIGTVTDGVDPLAGINVMILDHTGTQVLSAATTDAHGGFVVRSLTDTSQRVLLIDPAGRMRPHFTDPHNEDSEFELTGRDCDPSTFTHVPTSPARHSAAQCSSTATSPVPR